MTQPSIWLIGSPQNTGSSGIDALVRGELSGQLGLRVFDDLVSASAHLACSPQPPELIVLVQLRPGQFTAEQVEAMRRAAPLARVVRVVGSWCEGEGRSAPPPAGCASVYWHQWHAALGPGRGVSAARQTCRLVVAADCLARRAHARAVRRAARRGAGPVTVFARHPHSAAALADACRLGGYDVTIIDAVGSIPRMAVDSGPPPAILWDALPEQIADARAVADVRAICGRGPIVAIVGFARADDCRESAAAGVSAVVTKPYLIHDLLWQLAKVTSAGKEPVAGG